MKFQNKIILLSIFACLPSLNANQAAIIVNEDFYSTQGTLPPIVDEILEGSTRKLILKPAPVNAEGISVNKLTKLDLQNFNALDIELPQGSTDGDTYGIVFKQENANDLVYLTGIINNNNTAKVPLAIESRSSVTINSCEMNQFSEIYFESNNSETDACVEGFTINNFKTNNTPVIFIAEQYSLDGPLELGGNLITIGSDCSCLFDVNSKLSSVSGLEATCGLSFLNRGNLDIQGPLVVNAADFLSEGYWEYAPWTPEMINARKRFQTRTMVLDQFNDFGWLDDTKQRMYQRQDTSKGIINAIGAQINVADGGFRVSKAGKVTIQNNPTLNSHIISNEEFLLEAMKVDTQDGVYKEGFEYAPSELVILGNVTIHSKNSDILNRGSTFKGSGPIYMQAGKDIVKTNLSGTYQSHVSAKPHVPLASHKNKQMSYSDYLSKHNCFPFYKDCHNPKFGIPSSLMRDKENWCYKFDHRTGKQDWGKYCVTTWENLLTNNLHVQKWPGNEIAYHMIDVNQIALTDISGDATYVAADNFSEIGSISIYGEGSRVLVKTGGKYILKGSLHGVNSQETTLPVLGDGAESNSGALGFVSSILADKSGYIKIGGLSYSGGTVKIEAELSVEVDDALLMAKDAVDIETQKIKVEASIDMNQKKRKERDTKYTTWQPVYNTAGIYSGKKFNATADEVNIDGGFIASKDNSTIVTDSLNIKDISETRQNTAITKKRNILGSNTLTHSSSVTAHAQGELISEEGYVNVGSKKIAMEGGSIRGGQGEIIETKEFVANPHIVEHVQRIEAKRSGLRLPGIGNNLIDAINGEFEVGNLYRSMPFVQALSAAFKTKSPTDLAPSIRAVGEFYQAGETFSDSYSQRGSVATSLADLFMDQAGLISTNGIPVPSSIGFGKEVYTKESRTQIAYPSQLSGENIHISTDSGDLKAVEIDSKRLFLNVHNDLKIDSVSLQSSEKSSVKSNLVGISVGKNSVTGFIKHGSEKNYFETNRHQISKIFAGESAEITVQGNANLTAKIQSPGLKLHVTNHLNLETKQDSTTGRTSQDQVNVGITYFPTANSFVPSGGYSGKRGVYIKHHSRELTSIDSETVDIMADSMSVIGGLIKAKSGTIDVNIMTYRDLLDVDQATIYSLGLDSGMLKTLVNTMSSGNTDLAISETAYGSAIKGMIEAGYNEKDIRDIVHTTISQGIVINTNSDISGLNRDPSKARERIKSKDFHLSVAAPIVDIKQLGVNLKKMGATVESISQKLNRRIHIARDSIQENTQAQELWEGLQATEELVEAVKTLDVNEEEKLELLARLDAILSHPQTSQQYVVQVEAPEPSIVLDILEVGENEATYVTGDSVVLAVNDDFEKETLEAFESVGLGEKARNFVDKVYTVSEFLMYVTLYKPSEFGKGMLISPVNAVCESCVGYAKLADLKLEAEIVKKDYGLYSNLDLSEKTEILTTVGLEMWQQVKAGLKESFTTARGLGGITGDLAMAGAGVLIKTSARCAASQSALAAGKATKIANPIPKNMEFARVLRPEQLNKLIAGKATPLSSFPSAQEAFITASEFLPKGLSRKEYAKLLAIPEENVGGILRLRIKNSNDVALSTPYNRFEIPEFINGGKTAGDLPEFVIKNQDIRNFEFWIEEIK